MVKYRYGRFDDLIDQPGVQYFPSSRPTEADIVLPGLRLSDTADDFVVLEDAIICSRGGVVWRDTWLSASIQYMPGDWHSLHWLPGIMAPDGSAIDLYPECVQCETHIEEPVMLVDSGVGARNFGHSIHDSMPYGLLFQRARKLVPGLRPIVVPLKFKKQQEIFDIVFDHPYQGARYSTGAIHLKKLVLARRQSVMNNSDVQRGEHWYMPYAGLRHIRSSVYAALKVPGQMGILGDAPASKLFLHRFQNAEERRRNGLLQGRNFANHYELFEALMRQSFIVIEPGWLPLEQIVGLLASTRTAVGVHGAQCANTVFCRPGTKVFEIRGYPGNWRSIEAICAVMGHEFAPLQHSAPANPDAPEFDVERIIEAVKA